MSCAGRMLCLVLLAASAAAAPIAPAHNFTRVPGALSGTAPDVAPTQNTTVDSALKVCGALDPCIGITFKVGDFPTPSGIVQVYFKGLDSGCGYSRFGSEICPSGTGKIWQVRTHTAALPRSCADMCQHALKWMTAGLLIVFSASYYPQTERAPPSCPLLCWQTYLKDWNAVPRKPVWLRHYNLSVVPPRCGDINLEPLFPFWVCDEDIQDYASISIEEFEPYVLERGECGKVGPDGNPRALSYTKRNNPAR